MKCNDIYSKALYAESVMAWQELWLPIIIIIMSEALGARTEIVSGLDFIQLSLQFGDWCTHFIL